MQRVQSFMHHLEPMKLHQMNAHALPMHRYLYFCLLCFRPARGGPVFGPRVCEHSSFLPGLAGFRWQFLCRWCSCYAGHRVSVTAAAGFGYNVRERFPLLNHPVTPRTSASGWIGFGDSGPSWFTDMTRGQTLPSSKLPRLCRKSM